MTDREARVLTAAQQGLPLKERPFAALGERCGLTEAATRETLSQLQEQGLLREISAFLDPAQLGWSSTLACVTVPADRLEEVSLLLAAWPEVTHSYLRDHPYNLWFTVIAPTAEACGELLRRFTAITGLAPVQNLPATRVFKVHVSFAPEDLVS
ncbi:MAG TPA: Lrp/AsnC family transcriptional regulator [Armatimonadota bacterium]|jgi:DNA-binding Lrp family transcriptional regulator